MLVNDFITHPKVAQPKLGSIRFESIIDLNAPSSINARQPRTGRNQSKYTAQWSHYILILAPAAMKEGICGLYSCATCLTIDDRGQHVIRPWWLARQNVPSVQVQATALYSPAVGNRIFYPTCALIHSIRILGALNHNFIYLKEDIVFIWKDTSIWL